MYLTQELIYSEERGTWNLFVNGEWYFEGDYETCSEMMVNNQVDCYEPDNYYEEPYPEECFDMDEEMEFAEV